MSLLWFKDEDGAWIDHALDTDVVIIPPATSAQMAAPATRLCGSAPLLMRSGNAHGFDRWVLLCAAGSRTRVNGARVRIGARVLADRDSISVGDGCVVFFSSEQLARVTPFPSKDDGTCCIRCKLPLDAGTPAVRCPAPGCGFWHHQSNAQSCWTYTTACASCGHPTAFDAGFQWSPSEL